MIAMQVEAVGGYNRHQIVATRKGRTERAMLAIIRYSIFRAWRRRACQRILLLQTEASSVSRLWLEGEVDNNRGG